MTERESQVRTLVAELANALRRCERQATLERIDLLVKGVAPGGAETSSEVELRPPPEDAGIAHQATAQIEQIVAKWEAGSGLSIQRLSLVWRGDPPVRVPEDIELRQAH